MTTTLRITTTSVEALADALIAEDHAEEVGFLDALDRITCPAHRRWVHQCCHSDLHVSQVSGHRWCRPCRRALEVAIDEVTGTVALRCPTCERGARTRADAQLVAACEASLSTARRSARRAA
jgi:hypothetical protein